MVFATLVYAAIAAIAGLMSLSEHAAKGQRNPFLKALSLVACAVWPLVLAAMIVAMRRQMAGPALRTQTA